MSLRPLAIVLATLLAGGAVLAEAEPSKASPETSSWKVNGVLRLMARPERGGPDSIVTPAVGFRLGHRRSAFGIPKLRLGIDGEVAIGNQGQGNDTIEVGRTSLFTEVRGSLGYRWGSQRFAVIPELYVTGGLVPGVSVTRFNGALHATPSINSVAELGAAMSFVVFGPTLFAELGFGFFGLDPIFVHRLGVAWTF